ncbi:acyl-CoA dehydrogenase family protein [Rhodococcus koreensis]|uniref:acyl-CoA dehydrogenase family protein n=1 Tax=Rhodococcus koreensis TaxID=99653 RepID=UPI0019806082|nr:acyl-CoA dehydrogenase family protein [Rhodococcus koreensis]QSE81057.1 acyl-CoA dehydrogenase family protein [Rhodococcus koreensis]
MTRRTSPWMTGDIDALHEMATSFFDREVTANSERWEQQHHVDREFWKKAAELGLLCAAIPEEYGGGGGSFLHHAAIADAYSHTGDRAWGNSVHSGIVAHYLLDYGTEDQKRRWLPHMASGDMVTAIAMTEPSAGSDLKAIRTRAVREGDEYVITGSKTFITNGSTADLVVVAAKTNPEAGARGISLIIVETADCPGFSVGRVLDKIGQHGADTSELSFDGVRVPATNLLGEEGTGFAMMMSQLRQERLIIGISAVAATERALDLTVEYVKQREAFGAPLMALQNTRFQLAECATLTKVARVFLDDCIAQHMAGKLDASAAAMCKWWLTEVQCQVIDKCLQLFGGYGYMREYGIARLYADARAQKIYGGANEIQKELIARSL